MYDPSRSKASIPTSTKIGFKIKKETSLFQTRLIYRMNPLFQFVTCFVAELSEFPYT